MARQRNADRTKVKLKQPDRSGPSQKTLLELAEERNLFKEAERRQRLNDAKKRGSQLPGSAAEEDGEREELSPTVERILEAMLWTTSLSALHLTLDVLVQNQYAVEISWYKTLTRCAQAFLVFGFLLYNLHPHVSNPVLVPGVPQRYQSKIRQAIFFAMSTVAGCYLIHITNRHGYLAVMKRAPPIGCMWIWAVFELKLPLAVLSLASAYAFFWQGGYSLK